MSTKSTLVFQMQGTHQWSINEDMIAEEIWIDVSGPDAQYMAENGICKVMLPPALIDAIRALKPKYIPHLREKRAKALTARAKHGWETRRKNEHETLINKGCDV